MSDEGKPTASSSKDSDEEEEKISPHKNNELTNETSQRISHVQAMMNEKRLAQQNRGIHSMPREPMVLHQAVSRLDSSSKSKNGKDLHAGAVTTTLSEELMHALTEEMTLRNAKAGGSSEHQTMLYERLGKLMQCNATDSNLNAIDRDVLSVSIPETAALQPSAEVDSRSIASSKTDGKLSAHERMMLEKTRVKNERASGLRRKIEEDQKQMAATTASVSASTVTSVDSYGTSSDSVTMRAKHRERANRVAALGVAHRHGIPRVGRDYSSPSQISASMYRTLSTIEGDKELKAASKTSPSEHSSTSTRAVASVASARSRVQTSSSGTETIDGKAQGKAGRVAAAASRSGVSWVDPPSQSSQGYSQSSIDSSRAASIGSDDDTISKQRIRDSLLPSTAPLTRAAKPDSMADDHNRMIMEKRAVAGQLYDWAIGNNRNVDNTSEPPTTGLGPSTTPESSRHSPASSSSRRVERSFASSRSASSQSGQDVESTGSIVGSEGNLYQDKRFRSYVRDGLEEQMALNTPERGAPFADVSSGEVCTSACAVISERDSVLPSSAFDILSDDEASVHSMHSNSEIEAQVGLPVIFPGAFAITGMDHENDDGYISADIQSVATDYNMEEFVHEDFEEQVFDNEMVEIAALEATLAEAAVTVEGAVIQNDGELDKKTLRRLRTMQYAICMFAVCAVVLVTVSVLGRLSSVTGEKQIPTVEGWAVVGSTIVGPVDEAGTQFGRALDMTQDGKKVAVVAPGSDDGMINNVGKLYFFKESEGPNGTEWAMVMKNLKGPGEQRSTFASLAMSTDLNYIAVGYPDYENGAVMIYKENQATSEIDFDVQLVSNTSESSWFGYSLDLSDDGKIMAIGAPRSNTKNTSQAGAVHVFQRNGTQWVQLGDPIVGEDQDEFSGWSVTVANSNGSGIRVAIGSPVFADFTGRVRVLDWTGTSWKQVGASLKGEGYLNRYGDSMDFSNDGKVLAVGARGTFYESPGYVAIYEEIVGDWILKGDLIRGQTEGEGFGADVALSEDGKVIAIGAPSNNDFGEGSGSIRVFEFDEALGSWGQLGSAIGGQTWGEYGSSVSIDGNGVRVAGGAPLSDFDGRVTRAGSVGVFDRAP